METFEDVTEWLNSSAPKTESISTQQNQFSVLVAEQPQQQNQFQETLLSNNWISVSTASQHLTINSSEIEYHPILLPSASSRLSSTNKNDQNWSRRPSHESSDSGFFQNVPTPPSSYSSSSAQSPYSSLASPQSQTTFPDLYNNIGNGSISEDLELEKIVDDVDNMYREQLRKKAQEDLNENINVIRRNLPTKKDGISSYLSQTTQDIADQIARNLVDRALELDRKQLARKIRVKMGSEKLQIEKVEMLNNFAEVAVNRVTEQITSDLIKDASNDVSNILQHKCNGNPTLLNLTDVTKDNTKTLLNEELSKLVSDFVSDLPQEKVANFEPNIISSPKSLPKKKKSPAMQKRESLRRARNKNGILLSSLKKKIYHCNCIDCQAKRIKEGKPAYLEPIDVEEINLGDLPDAIPIPKKKSRGRPRKYPRLDDVLRYKNSLKLESSPPTPPPPLENLTSQQQPQEDINKNQLKKPEDIKTEESKPMQVENRLDHEISSIGEERPKILQPAKRKKLFPLSCRPGPLSMKKKWINARRTKPLVKLRGCYVPLESEKAVCQAFIAQIKKIQQKKKPSPNPQFILRPPLNMTE